MEEYLIEKVRSHDVLYNIKSSSYRDNNMRQEAWQEIGKDLNMTPELVKNIWERLRRCYLNALNRRRSKKGSEAVNKNPWKFEIQMAFLLPYINGRKHRDAEVEDHTTDEESHSFDEEEDVDNEIEVKPEVTTIAVENIVAKEVDPLRLQRTRKRKLTERNNVIQKLNKIMRDNAVLRKRILEGKDVSTNFTDMDENDMFFMSMSKITKVLPLAEQAKIKLQLSNAVLSAQIKMEETQQK